MHIENVEEKWSLLRTNFPSRGKSSIRSKIHELKTKDLLKVKKNKKDDGRPSEEEDKENEEPTSKDAETEETPWSKAEQVKLNVLVDQFGDQDLDSIVPYFQGRSRRTIASKLKAVSSRPQETNDVEQQQPSKEKGQRRSSKKFSSWSSGEVETLKDSVMRTPFKSFSGSLSDWLDSLVSKLADVSSSGNPKTTSAVVAKLKKLDLLPEEKRTKEGDQILHKFY